MVFSINFLNIISSKNVAFISNTTDNEHILTSFEIVNVHNKTAISNEKHLLCKETFFIVGR